MIEEFLERKDLQTKIWKSIEGENENIRFRFYNGMEISFNNQVFDAVFVNAVVEHIPAERLDFVFREIRRVLKIGGNFLIFRTPRKQSYAEHVARILQMGSHNILMDERETISMLKINGFKIIDLKRTDMVFGALPGKLQDIWNFLSPVLLIIDKLLLKTPINYLAHHMQVVCQRNLFY